MTDVVAAPQARTYYMCNAPSVWIRWREHPNGRVRWHDVGTRGRREFAAGFTIPEVSLRNGDALPTIDALKNMAHKFLDTHPEANAVLIEYQTELRHSDKEQARIKLAWFMDTKTNKEHLSEINEQ